MALQHPSAGPAPTLDVLLMAHRMAAARGEQLDVEAYMTDEMRREWFERREPFMPAEDADGSGSRKKRRISMDGDGTLHTASSPSTPYQPDITDPAYSPSHPSSKRHRTSLVEQHWTQRRRTYLPGDGSAGAHGSNSGNVEEQDDIISVPGGMVVPTPLLSNVGIGTGNWRRKPEVEADKEEVQASASYWNTLLIRARRDRGPQWDYSTQSYQVDRHSRAYYTHMDKPLNEDLPPPEEVVAGTGMGGAPTFANLTRTASSSGESRSGGMAIPTLPFTGLGAGGPSAGARPGSPRSRTQSISQPRPGSSGALLPGDLPPRSESLFPSLGSTFPPGTAPSPAQLQQLHAQQQQALLAQQQAQQAQQRQVIQQQQQQQGQMSQPSGSQPYQQLYQQQQAQLQQRLPPHLQHMQSSLHPQYGSPTSSASGTLPNISPNPGGNSGQLARTISPSSLYPSPGPNPHAPLRRTPSLSEPSPLPNGTGTGTSNGNGGIPNPSYTGQSPQSQPPPGFPPTYYPPPTNTSSLQLQPSQRATSYGPLPKGPQGATPQQQAWAAQAKTMGLGYDQFQEMMLQHQANQANGGGAGTVNPHSLGRPKGNGMLGGMNGSVNLAQITGGNVNGMKGGAGGGGPMLGGGGVD
ncbi:uncharacterized protein MKK02DRAFT_42714 [Dioszegia hungarica]|uniref:Uncharacterized protein n=1 Tax=Dioszegia hungarica TaxID=4972 RepID=A0AA38HBJ6_9TREE|nr:uncharacterized protein MKK02DRAFT_42714 [Dioszegia hungarica]KAI9638327.1 hypothetical protein MKK02DRAFT_42714 [Dioszegia hungarica]